MAAQKYRTVSDGEWIRPPRRGYRVMCCDCRLVHVLNFRTHDGALEIQAIRHKRATAAARRKK